MLQIDIGKETYPNVKHECIMIFEEEIGMYRY